MREILFRGERVDNGKWVYGTYGNHTSLDAMIIDRPYLTSSSDLSALNFWVVDPATVGQYTGLYDATKWEALSESEQKEWLETHTTDEWKGRRIFEGDIIKTKMFGKDLGHINVNDYDIFVVKYEPAMFKLDSRNRSFVLEDYGYGTFEIIGNIHDNPELLEANNE